MRALWYVGFGGGVGGFVGGTRQLLTPAPTGFAEQEIVRSGSRQCGRESECSPTRHR
jgi:hypothetical protein